MTEVDRWWIAYCALGAALIVRAPSWGWAVFVVLLWVVAGSLVHWMARWKSRSADAEPDAEQAALRTQFTQRARSDKTVVIPRVPPATATETVDRLCLGGFEPMAGMDAMTRAGAEVNRVVVSGRVWATDELVLEIRKTIERGRPPGGSRD